MRHGHRHLAFLGASPERLVGKQGRRIRVDALAGTAWPGSLALPEGKNRHEQSLVVRAICEALAPCCAAAPEVGDLEEVFHGNISKITPYDNVERPTVVLDCEDGKRWLMNTETESAGVNSGNALTKIDQLMTAIYPTRLGGVTTIIKNQPQEDLDYIYTLGTQSAITVLNDYVGATSDLWWIAADGVLHIKTMADFNNFTTATPTITESNTLKQFAVPVPWDQIANDNKSYYYVRRAVTSYVMWTGVEAPLVAAGASTTYFPQATYNNEVVPSAISAATVSITANTAADGSGTDLSASFSGVISASDAIGCILTITNNHGSLSGYITAITLTGTVYPAERKLSEDTDDASIAIYGKRRFILDNQRLNDSPETAPSASVPWRRLRGDSRARYD